MAKKMNAFPGRSRRHHLELTKEIWKGERKRIYMELQRERARLSTGAIYVVRPNCKIVGSHRDLFTIEWKCHFSYFLKLHFSKVLMAFFWGLCAIIRPSKKKGEIICIFRRAS